MQCFVCLVRYISFLEHKISLAKLAKTPILKYIFILATFINPLIFSSEITKSLVNKINVQIQDLK